MLTVNGTSETESAVILGYVVVYVNDLIAAGERPSSSPGMTTTSNDVRYLFWVGEPMEMVSDMCTRVSGASGGSQC